MANNKPINIFSKVKNSIPDETVIDVSHISKKFRVYFDRGTQLKERILFKERNRYEDRQVLKDINFSVKRGEAVGLIGHNGCGKSTTLKLLTRIMYPDSGSIKMKGRVVALIELGAGFHPDMSGRENIYTNASIFGLTKKEIDEKLDDIIAFSELEEFIDNPVRTYSSGMYTRLAFSVAINVDADILLIDEILAVGDAGFQAKCFNRLKEIKADGATIVIVSHALSQVEEICDRSIWIHEGLIKAEGKPTEVHEQYLDYIDAYRKEVAEKEFIRQEKKRLAEEAANKEEEEKKLAEAKKAQQAEEEEYKAIQESRKGDGSLEITSVTMHNAEGAGSTIFMTGEEVSINIEYKVIRPLESPCFVIGIQRIDKVLVSSYSSSNDGFAMGTVDKDGTSKFVINSLQLLPGIYSIDVVTVSWNGNIVTYKSDACRFEMTKKNAEDGIVYLPHKWEKTEERDNEG